MTWVRSAPSDTHTCLTCGRALPNSSFWPSKLRNRKYVCADCERARLAKYTRRPWWTREVKQRRAAGALERYWREVGLAA